MSIIGISGKIGVGKDQLANYIIELRPEYIKKSFAYKLKQMCAILTGIPMEDQLTREGKAKWMPKWGMTVGQMQQLMGTNAIRDGLHTNAWVIALMSDYDPSKHWVITDVRFYNEAIAIKNAGGILVRLNRISAVDGSWRVGSHVSETELDNYLFWDFLMENNGTLDDLRNFARMIVGDL